MYLLFHVRARDVARRELQQFARELEREFGVNFECLITDDAELRRLNREFRAKDYATDVLSFPTRQAKCLPHSIAISYDRAREQGRQFGHATTQEIQILLLHGVLHLKGLDHERDGGEMAAAERRWRKRFGLPLALTERIGA